MILFSCLPSQQRFVSPVSFDVFFYRCGSGVRPFGVDAASLGDLSPMLRKNRNRVREIYTTNVLPKPYSKRHRNANQEQIE